jgi:hypothetical protein
MLSPSPDVCRQKGNPCPLLHRHRGRNVRVGVIALQRKVRVGKAEDRGHGRIEAQCRQRARRARQLQVCLIQVVGIEVRVAKRVHKIPGLEAADLGQHQRQQRIGGDVEGHAQENVGGALVQLAAELAVGNVELEQAVTGRQGHLVHVGRVPGRNDQAAAVRVGPDGVFQPADLVDHPAIRRRPAAPLLAIDRAQIALGIGPFVPDPDAIVLQIFDVGVPGEKPQQFMNDGFGVQLLGGQQGKTIRQRESHLVAKDGERPRTGAVFPAHAMVPDMVKQI